MNVEDIVASLRNQRRPKRIINSTKPSQMHVVTVNDSVSRDWELQVAELVDQTIILEDKYEHAKAMSLQINETLQLQIHRLEEKNKELAIRASNEEAKRKEIVEIMFSERSISEKVLSGAKEEIKQLHQQYNALLERHENYIQNICNEKENNNNDNNNMNNNNDNNNDDNTVSILNEQLNIINNELNITKEKNKQLEYTLNKQTIKYNNKIHEYHNQGMLARDIVKNNILNWKKINNNDNNNTIIPEPIKQLASLISKHHINNNHHNNHNNEKRQPLSNITLNNINIRNPKQKNTVKVILSNNNSASNNKNKNYSSPSTSTSSSTSKLTESNIIESEKVWEILNNLATELLDNEIENNNLLDELLPIIIQ